MKLRYRHVRVITGVPDDRDALCISLEVRSIRTNQELGRVVTLEEERMAGGSVTVYTFKIEKRASRIAQFRCIRVRS